MTTVVAVCSGGRVHMAADSQTSVYDRPIVGAVKKILRLTTADGHGLLAAISGNGALAGLLDSDLEVPAAPAAGVDPQRWAQRVARLATQVAVDAGCVDDGRMDGSVLLGWDGRVWTVVHSQAIPHPDGIAAIGSGEALAVGAVDALLEEGVAPGETAVRAVLIACRRDNYSAEPVQVETLDPPARVGGEGSGGG